LQIAEEWSAAKIMRAPVWNGNVLQDPSEKILCWIRPAVNVSKKKGLARKKDRLKKEENQTGRYSEGSALFQNAQFHIQKEVSFDIIIVTKGPSSFKAKLRQR